MMMTDELLRSRDANFRMNPPLREEEDCEAIIEGIFDGTIDAIVTDHAPHAPEEKEDFLRAPNGIVGLETSFAAACTVLVHQQGMGLMELVRLMTTNPANIMRLPGGTLREGSLADIAIVLRDEDVNIDGCLLQALVDGRSEMEMVVQVRDVAHLYHVIDRLRHLPSVMEVLRKTANEE